jgi:hypothetical protein
MNTRSSIALVTSSVRLLCVMMDEQPWRVGLGLGGPYKGNFLLIYTCNFHFLSYLLLIYICKLHWNPYKGCPQLSANAMKVILSLLALRYGFYDITLWCLRYNPLVSSRESADANQLIIFDVGLAFISQHSHHARTVLMDPNTMTHDFLAILSEELKDLSSKFLASFSDSDNTTTKPEAIPDTERWRSKAR